VEEYVVTMLVTFKKVTNDRKRAVEYTELLEKPESRFECLTKLFDSRWEYV
jgi:hypothetical protein